MKKIFFSMLITLPFLLNAQVYNVREYHVNDAIYHGILINTNIPLYSDIAMVKIHFDGHDNGNSSTIGFDLCWAINNEDGISTASASAKGGKVPNITLLGDGVGNRVRIYLTGEFYYSRFNITAFAIGLSEQPSWFENWEISDEAMPQAEVIREVTYYNQFNDFVGISGELSVGKSIFAAGNVSSAGRMINNVQNSGSQGNYSSFSNLNLSQNAYLDNNIWRSYHPKSSSYGSSVILQTLGNGNKAFNVLVDTSVSASNEPLSFTNLLSVDLDGKTGVGTVNPRELFQVNGSLAVQGHNRGLRFNSFNNGSNRYISNGFAASLILDSIGRLVYSNSANAGNENTPATLNSAFVIDKDGKVGIGTISPQAELAVNGSIFAKKVRVTLNNWPDYVFEKGYRLPSLNEVENYIRKYKHLKGVPSRSEVLRSGAEVGDMQAVLLRKIEELTLYIIELNKRIEQLEKPARN